MYKEVRKQKQEIKKIAKEIDKILFGKINKYKFNLILKNALIGENAAILTNEIYNVSDDNNYSIKYQLYKNAFDELIDEDKKEVIILSDKLMDKIKEYKNLQKYINKYFCYFDERIFCIEENTIHPQIKMLPKEQIKRIHKRGNLTPKEKVKEWETLKYCAPGNGIAGSSVRCEMFSGGTKVGCHDCLVDYANQCDEWKPMDFEVPDIFKDAMIFYDAQEKVPQKKLLKKN